jgi:hypothetical protein
LTPCLCPCLYLSLQALSAKLAASELQDAAAAAAAVRAGPAPAPAAHFAAPAGSAPAAAAAAAPAPAPADPMEAGEEGVVAALAGEERRPGGAPVRPRREMGIEIR